MKNLIAAFIFLFLFSACTSTDTSQGDSAGNEEKETPVHIGVWEWESAMFSNSDTTYSWPNVDGFFIVTEDHYSLLYVFRAEPRPLPPAEQTFATRTADEFREILGGVWSNSGKYTIVGDSIQLYREVALSPRAMDPDNQPNTMTKGTFFDNDTWIFKFEDWTHVWKRRE